jgi:general secretion pathway protein K
MNPRRSASRSLPVDSRRRGSVVVIVLALVMLGAFFLSRFIERAMTEMLVEMRAKHASQLRGEAYSALEATLAVLADYQAEDGGLFSPAQGWGDPLGAVDYTPPGGVQVAVEFIDESGKLSLPRLDKVALEELGGFLDLKDIDATRFADALLAWTRSNHVSSHYETDPRNYEFADPPHKAPARPIESFEELASIAVVRDFLYDKDGQPTERWERMRQAVSLYDFPSANLNGASEEALILAGLDVTQAGQIRDFNAGKGRRASDPPQYFRNVAEAQALLGSAVALPGFSTSVQCLRIRVTAREGTSALRLEAVVTSTSSANREQQRQAGVSQTANQARPINRGPVPLQYPFTVLALDESIELQAAPSP